MTIDKLVVIGCSAHGNLACEYLVPKLRLNNNAVIIVPHLWNKEISEVLKAYELKVETINHRRHINPGIVYVYGGNSKEIPNYGVQFSETQGFRLDFGDNRESGIINSIMSLAAQQYQEKTLGVILTGTGNDGSLGVKAIKERGGKVLVQNEIENFWAFLNVLRLGYPEEFCPEMPQAAMQAVNVDFCGPLPGLIDKINEYLK